MRKRLSIIFVLLSAALFPAQAGNRYEFRHYTVDDGLPYNGVRTICQDRYGFMWFGLDNGLCRYDGVRMKSYQHNKSSADQYVPALFANDTCLWIGTSHGLTRMRFKDERFAPFTMRATSGVAITSTVLNITADSRGRLWISTQGQGVFCYNAMRRQLRQFPLKAANGDIAQVAVDRNGNVWAVPNTGLVVLYKLDKSGQTFKPFSPVCPYDLNYEVSTMTIDSQNNQWLGTRDHGIISISADGVAKSWLSAGVNAVNKVHSILEVKKGLLLVGSDDGLTLLDTTTGHTERHTVQNGRAGSLSDRFVYPLVLDREGGIWIGTFYGGVNYISPNSGRFQNFSHSTSQSTIGGNIVNRFAEDRNGNIWVASDDGGLNRLEPSTGRITRIPLCSDRRTPDNVHGLWADNACLWVGTYAGGICRLSLDGKSCRKYKAYNSQKPVADANSSYTLFRDSHGTLWNGSLESVSRYDPATDSFVFVKRLGRLVIDIKEDKQGNLWFATQGQGLFMLNRKGRWTHFYKNKGKSSLPDNNVNCVCIDSHEQIIIATQAGLCRYDSKKRQFTDFDTNLKDIEVSTIIEDKGTYWITTISGMVRYRDGEEPRWFNKHDGLQGGQFFPNAMLMSKDGHIYVGTNSGFSSFKPSDMTKNETAPTVAITALHILNKPVKTGSDILPLAINHTKRIDLSHSDNVFTLSFASQSYCTPENNKYAYRLDGFDKDWNYAGTATQAAYTNLSPGTYTFRVKATNNDGVWSKHEAVLKIVVHPPFLLSLPMKVLYIILLITAAVLAVKLLLRRAEKRHIAETEHIRAEKEREIHDAKIGFFTMIAHEIRTPVSLIIGPLENILKNTEQIPKTVSDDLNIIDRNARRLLYLVNQLLDFRKIEQKSLVARFTLCNIPSIVYAVGERFMPTFSQKGIDFAIECADKSLSATIDSEAITKVISNLLTNATKYGRTKVRLTCAPDDERQNFIITVSDDGQGVNPEDKERIFRPFFQSVGNRPGTGIGLSIVKNIIERHRGTINVVSEPGQGSVFTVTVPLSQPDAVIGENYAEDIEKDSLAVNGDSTYTAPSDNDNDSMAEDLEHATVLVVEDNNELLNFISNNLRDTYKVLTAKNGVAALSTLKSDNSVSLVLSDWMMPGMDGDELCRRIRGDQQTSHLPFILLTAKTDTNSKIEGLRCGADSYIEKPFSMQYLRERIRNLLNTRMMLRKKFSTIPLEPIKSIAPTEIDNKFLMRMQQIIEDNISNEELNVSFLADKLLTSRSGLYAKIKSLAGMTPNDMITLIRLKKAASMLKEGKLQINEICYLVGFNSPSYFSKCFKRQFGLTPYDFSISCAKKNI